MYIGVDLGTSAVKLLLINEQSEIINVVSKEYPLYMDERGYSEQDPNDWWEATKQGIKELGAQAAVKAISFSGQMHGLVILDENDKVIRNAILWNDQRTFAECEYLNNEIGRKKLIDYTANVALTGFTAPKILWVKNNEPDNFKRIKKIMLPKDYIAYKLSGVFCTDYSDASGSLVLDVKNKAWSKEMLDILGITAEQLPELYNSYDVVGNVKDDVASELGLAGCKVVAGGGDQAVGAVGTGTVVNNMCSISLGTSGVVFVASDEFTADYSPAALHSFCHASGKYHTMGVTLAAAASNKWWLEEILLTKDNAKEQEDIILGENNVYFLPYLSGERTPHNDPNAKGAFVGMSVTTKRKHMTQAVLEGVSYSLRDILEIVRGLGTNVDTARIIGGGAKSPLWCQMIANVFNVRVEKINSDEGPALGAAILAMVGDGLYATVEEAASAIIKVVESYEPDSETVKKYDEKYKHFTRLYKDLKSYFSS